MLNKSIVLMDKQKYNRNGRDLVTSCHPSKMSYGVMSGCKMARGKRKWM